MKIKYQVTLLCNNGKYKPVSCIITREQNNDIDLSGTENVRKALKENGIKTICFKRGWNVKDLKQFGYTKIKIRKYNKEEIEREAALRYEAIKEAKYQSGEWKRPKNK